MPELKQFKVRVKGEKYDMGPGELFDIIYKSTSELKIWKKIANEHSYGWFDDEGSETTVDHIIASVSKANSDGCDIIFIAEHEVDGVFVPVEGFKGLHVVSDVSEIDLDTETEAGDEENNF